MKAWKKMLIAVVALVPAWWAPAAPAQAGVLPPGLLIGDDTGLEVSRDGRYFLAATDLQPGEVIIRNLVIRNDDHGNDAFHLSMTAEPLGASGPVNLLDDVHLSLDLDGVRLYDGRLRGDEGPNMIDNALNLGVYDPGQRRTLTITLTVDPALGQFQEKSAADFKWHFHGVRGHGGGAPQTGVGDRPSLILLGGAAALLLGTGVLLAARRRRQAAW